MKKNSLSASVKLTHRKSKWKSRSLAYLAECQANPEKIHLNDVMATLAQYVQLGHKLSNEAFELNMMDRVIEDIRYHIGLIVAHRSKYKELYHEQQQGTFKPAP
ncbi:MAG: hypothetical protein L0Y56_20650 [Nitrospira sp.]|nr:hypothetical protein [Nitrospira sp.]